jgi:hypothetical protein
MLAPIIYRFILNSQLLFILSLFFIINNSVYSQSAGDYRSAVTGNWNTLATWQRYNGTAWVTPTGGEGVPSSTSGVITILSGHNVSIPNVNQTADQMTINSGGQVTVGAGRTLTIANGTGTDLSVNGTLVNSGTLTFNTGVTATFGSGSIYQHAKDAGTIPTANWNANSTCSITGVIGTIPTGLGQSFGHLTWNCPGQTTSTTPTTEYNIQGNLTIQNTNTGQFRMGTSATSINNVIGNYIQSGGTVRISGATSRVLNVSGNVSLSGGTLVMSDNTTVGTLNVAGNFTHTAGTITETSTGSGTIVFNGTSNQTYTGGGTISNTINFTLNNAAGLTLNSSVSFPAALTLTNGNITTGSNVLTLGTSATNLGSLTRTAGTIVGNFKRWFTTGTINNVLFPIGTASNYRPANISFTSAIAAAGSLTVAFIPVDPGSAGLPLNDAGTSIVNVGKDGYWSINSGDGLSGGTYSLDLTADGFSGVSVVSSLRLIKRQTGSNWILQGSNSPGTGTTSTPVVHRTGMSGFSEFGVGGASDNPLPVELSSFSAIIVKEGIKLNWGTETEVNNYGFEIHRSTQNDSWINIGFVQGNGNSNSPKEYSFLDEQVPAGKYSYRLKQIDTDGNFKYSKVIDVNVGTLTRFELNQNYPNPFNPSTTISFTLPESGNVNLTVYNIIGEQVVQLFDGYKEAGIHTINFNASELNSSIYIYKLEQNGRTESRKMMLVK